MANGHGGPRAGSGRPKGTTKGAQIRSRLSPEQQARAAEAVRLTNGDGGTFGGDAYALLAFLYKSKDLPLTLRMRAAEAAIAYERPKLTRMQVAGDEDNLVHIVNEIMALLEGTGRGLPAAGRGVPSNRWPASANSAAGERAAIDAEKPSSRVRAVR